MDTTFEELKNVKSDCCIKIIFQTLRTPGDSIFIEGNELEKFNGPALITKNKELFFLNLLSGL